MQDALAFYCIIALHYTVLPCLCTYVPDIPNVASLTHDFVHMSCSSSTAVGAALRLCAWIAGVTIPVWRWVCCVWWRPVEGTQEGGQSSISQGLSQHYDRSCVCAVSTASDREASGDTFRPNWSSHADWLSLTDLIGDLMLIGYL